MLYIYVLKINCTTNLFNVGKEKKHKVLGKVHKDFVIPPMKFTDD